jgi:hypothetical protein
MGNEDGTESLPKSTPSRSRKFFVVKKPMAFVDRFWIGPETGRVTAAADCGFSHGVLSGLRSEV